MYNQLFQLFIYNTSTQHELDFQVYFVQISQRIGAWGKSLSGDKNHVLNFHAMYAFIAILAHDQTN